MKCAILSLWLTSAVWAQTTAIPSHASAVAARQWREQHERAILDEFVALLAIPNVSSDKPGIQRNADALVKMFERRGVAAKLVTVEGANPVVFGEVKTPGATRTIVFYAHYDGQPLDPKEWATPPFAPTLRNAMVRRTGKSFPCPPPARASIPSGDYTRVARPTTKPRSLPCYRRSIPFAPRERN